MMTITELKAVHAAMTKGPLVAIKNRNSGYVIDVAKKSPTSRRVAEVRVGVATPEQVAADARGIVALHNHFAEVLARYEAMRDALDACVDIITSAIHEDAAPLVAVDALANADAPLEATL